jgi:hypothetical protein
VGGGQPFLAGAVNDMSAIVTATHQVELRVAEWRLFAMVNTISAGAIRAEDLQAALNTAIDLYGLERLGHLVTRRDDLSAATQGILARIGIDALVDIHSLSARRREMP